MTAKEENAEHLLSQLEEKVKQELEGEHVYEALQYIQSFIARKKKILGQKGTSNAVFLGANLLTANFKTAKFKSATPIGSPNTPFATLGTTTGALLKWFIEDGAGLDYDFNLYPELVNSSHYCDVENTYNFLTTLETNIAGPIVDAIYNPLHVIIAKKRVKKNSPLWKRINKLEILFAATFFANKRWLNAFKSYNRLGDAEKMTEVLNQWSEDGYSSEKPLFFARGVLQLLSEHKITLANDLLHNSIPHIEDNIALGKKTGGPMSSSLAVWHVATILTDLANAPPAPRVDKTKLYGLILKRYGPLISTLDNKLFEIFTKVGESCFNFVLENPDSTPNPMAMLQSLLTGGAMGAGANSRNQQAAAANRRGNPPPFDFNNLMQLMSKMGQL